MVNSISAADFKRLAEGGASIDVIDVRTPAEFESLHIKAARNHPLDRLDPGAIQAARNGTAHQPLYIVCRSGSRGRQACEKFIAAGHSNVINIEGGTMACQAAGMEIITGKKSVPIHCQVQIIVGTLSLVGSALTLVHPYWAVLPAAMGAGLLFSGLTDSCVLGMMLSRMPWNNTQACSLSNKS